MELFRKIPKIDKFIEKEEFKKYPLDVVTKFTQEAIENLRNDIKNGDIKNFQEEKLVESVLEKIKILFDPSLKTLFNGSGVIIHTNLGRSLISEEIYDAVKPIATSYNNLEYDLEKGERGERYVHVSNLIRFLTGSEDALVVNNNASAVFLILNTFAKEKEVVVSRGELVEIGGSFRIPDVMSESGGILKEVGTTNKTHLRDYENSTNENTKMYMKVHKSNYSIEGFTKEVDLKEMATLAKEKGILSYYDMGGGHLIDLPYSLSNKEPNVKKVLETGVDLLSFSGDKLLGATQAGIIVGKKELIDRLKKNHLLRMVRVDKITLALLEESLRQFAQSPTNLVALDLLLRDEKKLEDMATILKRKINTPTKIIKSKTVIGGGTTPNRTIPTICLEFESDKKPNELEKVFRKNMVIGRIEDNKFLLDLRSILEKELDTLGQVINGVLDE
ncbi:MAG: L-seryl-tRNA(Sec) selenium transferase [Campylobacterales bacterium]|nr:L-seryl-tRNA(Sec) selenium transferase [Campylobacterales bacterium]